MSDLLTRATGVLDVLAADAGRSFTAGEVAGMAAISAAACTRLLKRLVALGWADQDGNRGAYRLGPRAYALGAGGAYRRRLLTAAAPSMRELAARWPDAGVVLLVLRSWARQLVWECGAFRRPGQRFSLLRGDLWTTATGAVLVANLPPRERTRCLAAAGLPTATEWRGVATRRELLAALADIRREGSAERYNPAGDLYGIGVPVPDGDGGIAALGAFRRTAAARGELRADLLATAATIAGDLRSAGADAPAG